MLGLVNTPRLPRRILVTGASRGIGRATALACARRGDRVVAAARSTAELEALAAEIGRAGGEAEILTLDVTSDASVDAAITEILARGPLDVLVNNAGIFDQRPFLAQDPAQRMREMDVNFFGAQRMTRAVLPAMIRRGQGTIVNVSSLVGAIPCPSVANYSATKAALNAWTHALRGEVAQHGIRMVVFMPSHTATEKALATTRFDGVPALPVDYAVRQLLLAIDRAPPSMAASPVFRMFLRLAGIFPRWGERQMAASTRALVEGRAVTAHSSGSTT
jgi:short-subunit dehydrogenase